MIERQPNMMGKILGSEARLPGFELGLRTRCVTLGKLLQLAKRESYLSMGNYSTIYRTTVTVRLVNIRQACSICTWICQD